jgi:hypothetical protein
MCNPGRWGSVVLGKKRRWAIGQWKQDKSELTDPSQWYFSFQPGNIYILGLHSLLRGNV